MRWTIALTAAGVLLVAGIAVSQQPPDNTTPTVVGGAAPPSADAAGPQTPPGVGTRPNSPTFAPARYPTPNVAAPGGWSPLMEAPFAGRFFSPEADPETAELNRLDHQFEQESRGLVNQLAEASEDDAKTRDQLKQKLRDTLERQFDAQQKIRESEVTRIEARVKKLRELITKRNAARQTIVDRRQQQLIDDAEGFGWSSAGTATPPAMLNQFAAPAVMALPTLPAASNFIPGPPVPPRSAPPPAGSPGLPAVDERPAPAVREGR